MNTQGSALLLVISMMSILIIICALCLRSTTILMQLVYERGTYQRQVYANKALLEYVTQFAREQFALLSDEQVSNENRYTIQAWPPTTKEYNAHITIQRSKPDKLILTTQLFKQTIPIHTLQCCLCQITDGRKTHYHIQDWQYVHQ